jgi:iron complex transport system substrate-binding protein
MARAPGMNPRSAPWFRISALLGVALLSALLLCAMAAEAAPHRIVSANLCADRLLLQLADRADIVSVSHYATDPDMSTVATQAAGIPPNHADAEEILAFRPDLVLLGWHGSLTAGTLLRSLGVPVYALPVAGSIAEVRSAIRGLAAALGVPERGERLIAAMDARFAALASQPRQRRAAIYLAGGWSPGRDSLGGDLLTSASLVNIAAAAGISGLGGLPLESLVAAGPDLLVFEEVADNAPSIAGALIANPVLAESGAKILYMPTRLWSCPDPAIAEAAALIAGALP